MSLNTILLLPLMVLAGCYVLTPVVNRLGRPHVLEKAYFYVGITALVLWMLEVAVYILGSIANALTGH